MKKNHLLIGKHSYGWKQKLKIMRWSLVLFIIAGLNGVMANSFSQEARLKIYLKDKTLVDLFISIEKQSEYKFFYQEEQLKAVNKSVSIETQGQKLTQVLDVAFQNTDLNYRIVEDQVLIYKSMAGSGFSSQERIAIKGIVTDTYGEPIPGVNVFEMSNPQNGVITGIDGSYLIKVNDSNSILSFSFIGFEGQDINVGNRKELNIVLVEATKDIDEVVVTALGIKREKKALGYAVQNVGGEELTVAKGTNVATNLTGKVAGLLVKNSTEFSESPSIQLRGAYPLLVVDGVAYSNMSLSSISADDIASMDILKGATAAALYGMRGRKGAIMITTKSGQEKDGKIKVSVSNNTMFRAGYLTLPERQTSYSSGQAGKFNNNDFVWGEYMNGQMVKQYNPKTKEYEDMPLLPRGKDNLENFLENSYIMNNNISVRQSGKLGGFRVSGTQIHHKGDYPNTSEDKYIFNVGGNIDYNNFKLDASINYSKEHAPNIPDRDYGAGNIIYNMLVWTGSEYDIRDYKDYWVRKDIQQSWQWKEWYDNPYFLMHERINKEDKDYLNGKIELSYKLLDELSLTFRTGYDSYSRKFEERRALSTVGDLKGSYWLQFKRGYSLSNDFLINGTYKWNDFSVNVLGGLSSYYYEDEHLQGSTKGGLSVPGFYSLKSSIEPANVSSGINKKLVYGAYGKVGLSYKSIAFIDVTGRNDWSSTLPEDTRSYFYPSVSGSFIPTEIFNPLNGIVDFLKLRGSWAVAKKDLSIYELNRVYSVSTNQWNGLTTASYPGSLRGLSISAETERTYEFGADIRLFKNRIGFDVAYFNRLQYNRIVNAGVSDVTGFGSVKTNSDEEHVQKGMEFTLTVRPIVSKDLNWTITSNLAYNHWYYHKLDPKYSTKDPRYKEGDRLDRVFKSEWERDYSGNLILHNGYPRRYDHDADIGNSDPDFFWGISNSVSYKNFQLNFSFDGRVGGLMYNWTEQALWNTGAHPDSDNQYRFDEAVLGLKNYVAKGVKVIEGEVKYDPFGKLLSDTRKFAPNDVPVSYEQYVQEVHGNAYSARVQNMMEATFFKLREVALNYTLPKKMIKPLGMTNMQVGIIGQNLWIWSKNFEFSDPDRGKENLNAPSKRFVGFNVNMTF
ncbi:MAG: SusC/RagA family TonB-linked outer membrane protein [Carboxylicivirga sp.]|jgi:TonB-linked SusC/RagA family outer membrane protein|nr:SusC/RagA family TonB-linked outer membrane protein [Carboxylicivirga sp.]